MPFDPTWPPTGADIESAPCRAQFNALNDRDNDLATQITAIPAGPQGIQGPAGNDGNDGIDGGMVFPVTQTAVFDAPVHLGTQELKFDTTRDIGGSGEALAGISAIDLGSGPLLQIRCRGNGTDKSLVRLDPTGIQDGAGNPTVQDGDLLRYDAANQTWEPTRRPGLSFADLSPLNMTVSDPPTQTEMQTLADRMDAMLSRAQGL